MFTFLGKKLALFRRKENEAFARGEPEVKEKNVGNREATLV